MNNSLILVGCVVVVAIVALTAMANYTPQQIVEQNSVGVIPQQISLEGESSSDDSSSSRQGPSVEYDFVPQFFQPNIRYLLIEQEDGSRYAIPVIDQNTYQDLIQNPASSDSASNRIGLTTFPSVEYDFVPN